MPKLKTNSGVKKRFSLSSGKKVKRKKAYSRHILSKKSSSRLRSLRKAGNSTDGDAKNVKRLLPYG